MRPPVLSAPTGDPLDTVHLILEQDELVIAPAALVPEEELLRPVLPVDGGWLCVELRTRSGSRVDPGYMGGAFDTDDVPLWVELVYGHDVVEAARELLASRAAGRSQDRAVVETRWHSEPTATTRCLARLTLGMWIRRYWPSPVAVPLPQPDPALLDLELASLSLRGQVPGCFGLGGITSAVLGDSAAIVPTLAQHVIDGSAATHLHRRLRVVLRDLLGWLLDLGNPDQEPETEDSPQARLAQLHNELADPHGLLSGDDDDEDMWGLAAGARPRPAAEHAANQKTRHDSVDWGVNEQGLLDTDSSSVTWEHDNGSLRVSVRLSPHRRPDDALPQVYARAYRRGTALPLLIDLAVDDGGRHLVGARGCDQGDIDCVDIVSVERPEPALRGAERQGMVREQEEATAWARDRRSLLFAARRHEPDGELPDNPVPADLELVTGEAWLAERTTVDALCEPAEYRHDDGGY